MLNVLIVGVLVLIVSAIVYGFFAIKILAKKAGIDIKEATQFEIDRVVVDAINCAEEWARAKMKLEGEKIKDSAKKLEIAIGRAKMFIKNVSDEEIKTLIFTKLGEMRRVIGEKVEYIGKEIADE